MRARDYIIYDADERVEILKFRTMTTTGVPVYRHFETIHPKEQFAISVAAHRAFELEKETKA
jgi:hypothetical protein